MPFLGQILDVDLYKRKWTFSAFPEEAVCKFLGGRGFNVWFLYHHILPKIDSLGPENVLLFSCGLLTGTRAPASSRLHVSAISPLTGLLGSSNVGGDFGVNLRSCNIQSLIIRGKSPKPVYLYIDHDTIQLVDAQPLWGLDTRETEEYIKKELNDDKIKIMVIGPGGENGARFGCIMTDRDHAAGRTGMGTVMGSKNLKAIVIKGKKQAKNQRRTKNGRTTVANYVRQITHSADFKTFSTYGGAGYIKWCDEMGIMATRNYRESRFEDVDSLDGRRLRKYVTRSRGCYRCPIQCKAELQFHDGKFNGTPLARPEFESIATFGPKCGLSDLKTVVFLDNLCSRLGLDSISAGTAIAFAMDLYEREILTLQDTGDLDLQWGNGKAMETLIRQMAYQEGFGVVLSQGVRRAVQIIGKRAERFAAHVKGLELSAYNPREIMGAALGYAVASRGGDFSHIYPSLEYRWSPERAAKEFGTPLAVDIRSTKGKGLLVKRVMIVSAVLDCLGLCKVPVMSLMNDFDLENEAELTTALVGRLHPPYPPQGGTDWSPDANTLFRIGERIINLERLFNIKHGAHRDDDCLPPMFLETETSHQNPVPLEPMLQDFYTSMGWDKQGQPLEKTLNRLEI